MRTNCEVEIDTNVTNKHGTYFMQCMTFANMHTFRVPTVCADIHDHILAPRS